MVPSIEWMNKAQMNFVLMTIKVNDKNTHTYTGLNYYEVPNLESRENINEDNYHSVGINGIIAIIA